MPDAIGIALDEWFRDRTSGIQQELIQETPTSRPGSSPLTGEVLTAMPVRGTASGHAEAPVGLGGYNSAEGFMGTCPDCGSQMEYAEGCVKCHVCGFSECG